MKILAIDMGWSNSVSCLFDSSSGEVQYQTLITGKEPFAKLLKEMNPEQVVIEAGAMAGGGGDVCGQLKRKLLGLKTKDEPGRGGKGEEKKGPRGALERARGCALWG